MKLPIGQIVVDNELYPRQRMRWQMAKRYEAAMAAGAVFPPLVVGRQNGQYVLLDGRHRLQAWKRRGQSHVPVTVSSVKPREFFAEAVRLNSTNGVPYTEREVSLLAGRLRRLGYSDVQVAKLLSTAVERVKLSVTTPALRGHPPRSRVLHQLHILRQVLSLLTGGELDQGNRMVRRLLARLRTILADRRFAKAAA